MGTLLVSIMRPLKSANYKTSEAFLGNLLHTSKWPSSCLRVTLSKVQKTGHPDVWSFPSPSLHFSPTGPCFNTVHAALEKTGIDLLAVTRGIKKHKPITELGCLFRAQLWSKSEMYTHLRILKMTFVPWPTSAKFWAIKN